MELKVDTGVVKDAQNKLKNAIRQYGDNNSNLFYSIDSIKNSWIGPDADSFFNGINTDRKAARDIINYLNELDKICSKIVSSYDNFK